MTEPLRIRRYRPKDAEALVAVFRSAVRGTGSTVYGPEQVNAWANFPPDLEAFRAALARGLTLVAEVGGTVAAFGQVYPEDHVEYLYTAAKYNRSGLGGALYARLEEEARTHRVRRLTTKASLISRPFFEKAGFRVTKEEAVERGGVTFRRFRMEKRLAPSQPARRSGRPAVAAAAPSAAPPPALSVSVSRTIATPLPRLFDAWHSAAHRRLWLHVAGVTTRRVVAGKSLRLNWNDDGSTVLVRFETIVSGRCVVTVLHEGIHDATRAAELKKLWTESLDRLRRRLER